mmetsp:Transcript_12381/g.40453  ORF Transcript_12381/g.40453 Transcript_12381/m.40453 type:complete len:541 (-) Transcript_12381:709-2331(-)
MWILHVPWTSTTTAGLPSTNFGPASSTPPCLTHGMRSRHRKLGAVGGMAMPSRSKAPLLPMPRIRPVITEQAPPEIDDEALDAYLERTSPWGRRFKRAAQNEKNPAAAQPVNVRVASDPANCDTDMPISGDGGIDLLSSSGGMGIVASKSGASSASTAMAAAASLVRGGAVLAGADDDFVVAKLAAELRLDDLRGIVVRLKPPTGLEPVWSSLGTASGSQVSVWQPDKTKAASRTALRLGVGHYCANGVDDPLKSYLDSVSQQSSSDTGGADVSSVDSHQNDTAAIIGAPGPAPASELSAPAILCIELCDTYTFRRNRGRLLAAAAERLCPPPLRFRQVWHLSQGERSVYGWAPVPKSDTFVALGHVATRHPEPPDVRCVRTIPLAWCDRYAPLSELGQTPAWTNSSLGGRKGALWRQFSTGLLIVGRGHGLPSEMQIYRLRRAPLVVTDYPETIRDTERTSFPGSGTSGSSAQQHRTSKVAEFETSRAFDHKEAASSQDAVVPTVPTTPIQRVPDIFAPKGHNDSATGEAVFRNNPHTA